jgi:CHAD domain-containing protein
MLELGHWVASLEELDQALPESSTFLARRADEFAASALTRLDRKARKRAPAALEGPPVARHALRLTSKKLRYSGEFFRSLYGSKDARRYLRKLARLQDLLGALNDIETAQRLLQQLLDRCTPERAVEFARAAGFVEGYAARDEERALRKLAERWTRFEATRGFWLPKE